MKSDAIGRLAAAVAAVTVLACGAESTDRVNTQAGAGAGGATAGASNDAAGAGGGGSPLTAGGAGVENGGAGSQAGTAGQAATAGSGAGANNAGTGGEPLQAGAGAGASPGGAAGQAAAAGEGSGGAVAGEGSGGGAAGEGGEAGSGASGPPRTCEGKETLRDAAECTSRLVGTAVSEALLSNSTFTTIAAREFNYVTPENEMKWGSIEPSQDNFNFGPADRIVDFALQNGMKVKGHTLIWHNQLPSWVSNMNNADQLRAAILNHIQKLLEHYKGKVDSWDVVNEAWDNPNDWPSIDEPTLRNSVFMRVLGEGFIDEAFIAARAADPDIKLYYNDFRSEAVGQPKGDAIFEMIRGMVERGVPIDGVGLQVHLGLPNDKPNIEDVIANMQRLSDLGLEVLISEMDDHVCDGETPAEQGVRFHDFAAACVNHPNCPAFTVWGISDGPSWLNSWDELDCMGLRPAGLMWDDNYQKKPAYDGVLDALNGL